MADIHRCVLQCFKFVILFCVFMTLCTGGKESFTN